MSNAVIANLEKLLGGPRDGALLRYSLGNEYLKLKQYAASAAAFAEAVARDPNFSAAWKLLGKAHLAANDSAAALAAFEQGIIVATAKGDVQAVKEMQVFVKRLNKAATSNSEN